MYFDDIEYATVESDGVQIPIDFESTELTYTFSDFAGGVATVIDNPGSVRNQYECTLRSDDQVCR